MQYDMKHGSHLRYLEVVSLLDKELLIRCEQRHHRLQD